MIKFTTKAKLVTYLGTQSPREAKYIVLTDETLQNKKSVYQYSNGELILLSNEVKEFTWKTSVETYAVLSEIADPTGMDAVIVLVDETRDGQPTQYYYDGYTWIYNGIYFKEELTIAVSDKNTRVSDITLNTDYTLPFKYVVGSGHLEIYLEEIALIGTIDFIEVGTLATVSDKVQFKSTIPKEARLIFKRNVASNLDETIVSRKGKIDIYYYATFTDAQNSPLLLEEGQVIRTFGHVSKNDGKGRFWILEDTDKDFGYRNNANTLFINRMICADEVQIGHMFMQASGVTAPAETVVLAGQIGNRSDFKRVWAWAQENGRVVSEAEYAANPGCFSSGDLSTTFRFPSQKDFIRGWDGTIAVGTLQNDAMQGHKHTSTLQMMVTAGHDDIIDISAISNVAYNTDAHYEQLGAVMNPTPVTDGTNGTPRTAAETRPKNTTQKYYIKI